MDKIKLLQSRRQQLLDVGKDIRNDINVLIDKDSFVELSTFSFSKNDFYGENAEGEGVITGFATIDDKPFYIVAQNSAVFNGGISKANCQKIIKCLEQAEKNQTPVIYLLSSCGVQVGEGVDVLEGIAQLFAKVDALHGVVPQYMVVNGEVYGQVSVLAGLCDFVFFIEKKSLLAANSPLVISATSGENLPKEQVCGYGALTNAQLATFVAKDLKQVKQQILQLLNLLSVDVADCEALNDSIPELNKSVTLANLLKVFDEGSAIELGASYCPQIKCYLGRIGGIAVACVFFDNKDGVKLSASKIRKINDLAQLACFYNLPFINFVNTLGICPCKEVNDSPVLKEIGSFVNIINSMDAPKLAVVCDKAIGLGYTLFAAKSLGYDFTCAFANARIGLFDGAQGAEIEYSGEKNVDKQKLIERYNDEKADPVNAAKGGYIDNIIEPEFVRQYLIASLQMYVM